MSQTKLPLGRNNSVMTSLCPPMESLVVTSRLCTGNSRTFFLRCSRQNKNHTLFPFGADCFYQLMEAGGGCLVGDGSLVTGIRFILCARLVFYTPVDRLWRQDSTGHTTKTKCRNLKQIFPEKEYRGLSPYFHIHVSVREFYILTMGLHILLQEICGPILGLYKSLTDKWMWKMGLRPRNSQKRNT